MEIFLIILAFVLLICGILGSILPILPGLPLSYIGLLLINWSGFGSFSTLFLIVFAVIVVVISFMDYFLPSIMAKKFGGSRYASIGSFLGLIIGVFFFAPWGMIIGAFLGAFVGELIHNNKDNEKALKVALGAFLAFIVGTGAKLITACIMLFFGVKALFA
ncbi:MAG: DUF456 domain-containing protein [Treponema sp.]|nr:DUF456 domain-containing protein [Treponema sp.]